MELKFGADDSVFGGFVDLEFGDFQHRKAALHGVGYLFRSQRLKFW